MTSYVAALTRFDWEARYLAQNYSQNLDVREKIMLQYHTFNGLSCFIT